MKFAVFSRHLPRERRWVHFSCPHHPLAQSSQQKLQKKLINITLSNSQSTNQSSDQSSDQSINQSIDQSINRATNQSISESNQSIDRSTAWISDSLPITGMVFTISTSASRVLAKEGNKFRSLRNLSFSRIAVRTSVDSRWPFKMPRNQSRSNVPASMSRLLSCMADGAAPPDMYSRNKLHNRTRCRKAFSDASSEDIISISKECRAAGEIFPTGRSLQEILQKSGFHGGNEIGKRCNKVRREGTGGSNASDSAHFRQFLHVERKVGEWFRWHFENQNVQTWQQFRGLGHFPLKKPISRKIVQNLQKNIIQ